MECTTAWSLCKLKEGELYIITRLGVGGLYAVSDSMRDEIKLQKKAPFIEHDGLQ